MFDRAPAEFDRHRAFPPGVPETIRSAIWASVEVSCPARVLDVGAGTGRIGKAFVAANDSYVGVDLSFGMLIQFLSVQAETDNCLPLLVQASAEQLPFRDETFDVALLMQVLRGARGRQRIVSEVRRVLRKRGALVIGQLVMPPEGVDAALKTQLSAILEDLGMGSDQGKRCCDNVLVSLESSARRRLNVIAASWQTDRTPKQFLERHRTGARFATLPSSIQKAALRKLATWAESTYGSLDSVRSEQHVFELDIFQL